MTIVASDDFNRADTAATTPSNGLIGQTTSVGSKTWLNFPGAGLWDVKTNQATCHQNGTNRAGIDTGLTDLSVQADVTSVFSTGNPGVVLRYVNQSNWINAIVTAGGIYVQKNAAGAQSNVISNVGGANPDNTPVTLKLKMVGTTCTVYRNGVQVGTVTISDAGLQTGTKAGLFVGSNADKWDNFIVDDGVTTTPVNANPATLKWDLRTTVDSTPATLKWNLRAAIDATAKPLIWNLRATIDATPATVKWDLRATVDANPRTLKWNLAAQTSAATATLLWNLAAITDANPATLKWDLYAQANATRSIIWNLYAKSNRWPEQTGNDWPANTGDNWPQATTAQRWPVRS